MAHANHFRRLASPSTQANSVLCDYGTMCLTE
jgi:hypothetical protein